MQKIIIPIIFAISLISCSKKEETVKEETKGFELSQTMLKSTTFAKVEKKFIEDEYSFYGKISADKNTYIDIFPLVGGNVLSVNVELGDYVHKGQVLATIRSTELAEVQKDVSDAKTDLLVAENNLRVSKEMYAGKLNTEKDILETQGEVQKAKDALHRSNAVSTVYNVKRGNIYSVISPINGYIVHKDINKDMELRSDRSENIFDVANTKNVWAIMNVNEAYIDKINLGMKAQVSTLSYPDKVFFGKIDKVFKIIDPGTNSMQARVVLDNSQGLLIPESKATIRVSSAENETALAIPSGAVIFDDNRYFVVVYKSQTDIKVKEIKILKQNTENTYVASGLAEGETVVTNNQLLIYRSLNN
ncbi:efflux RND transporter periplasmic adaptor subunit [Epilithonimonas ginsengisoli]|uniref:Efflux RND transporter periplasmic adaptor subunit n=1 Tax=Epilithonimonas ginsengisoli TaxID=1245592 RepID=A0ABU4JJV6_9FLAO|nr:MULTISPECIES: efflux RND transporter periplasmic adaptor subunit [Chryseobacterium group]MBV6881063.1 efflux RND transporter periplasmic adaptor subunit [Epilithonimonas sp. FP105]MDW8549952.1 efflux RND transporter periplasmic adaptor subunit [Epilithonimonas ginsengisoli]OAH76535.1 efflux transporter periplasmic adaptor subunit [Chryseobacterium sp. FP211-J200]